MEGSCFVENGGIKMPIGYRFLPTDEELIVHYLNPKVLGLPFPCSIIPEFDVFQTDPWRIPGDLKEKKRYFFGNRRKMGGTGGGYWKPVGKRKLIVGSGSNEAVGIRKTLVFCENKRIHGTKTRWFMHQFCLTQRTRDWAVYGLFQKKIKHKKQVKKMDEELRFRPNLSDFMVGNEKGFEMGPTEASCCSSSLTDEDDSPFLDQEASSNVFSSCFRKQD